MWMNFLVFFFKQKTAYEMRISDWSSDVCSSDLAASPKGVRKMAKETNRIDIYQAVTDDILAMLEAGTKPWVKPWSGGPTIPLRHNGVAYRGINVLSLWASAMRQGFASRSEEHTSELQSLMRISYAVFCLKK